LTRVGSISSWSSFSGGKVIPIPEANCEKYISSKLNIYYGDIESKRLLFSKTP